MAAPFESRPGAGDPAAPWRLGMRRLATASSTRPGHPGALGDGLGMPRSGQLPARARPGLARATARPPPELLPALCRHPGIGFVLVRSEQEGAVVLGPRGTRHLDSNRVEGEDPLAPFGPNAADHVRRTDAFPHCADLMINSAFDRRPARSRPSRSWSAPTAAWAGPIVSLRPAPRRPRLARGGGGRRRTRPPDISRLARALGHAAYSTEVDSPGGEHPQLRLRRQLRHPPRELERWIAQRPRTQAVQKPRVERPPVDRHDDLGFDQRRRARRPLGIHMPRPEARTPPQIGNNARSTPCRARIPSKRSVSPAK